MRPFLYGPESLYRLRNQVINTKLKPSIYKQLKELNIAKQTRRGCRAGRNKRRPIQVCINNRVDQCNDSSNQTRSNFNNLINIKPSKGASIHNVILKSRIATWNSQSMMNKHASVSDLIIDQNLDILAITEAWLKGDDRDHPVLADISTTLPDYVIHQLARVNKGGGGICVIARKGYEISSVPHKFETFECLELSISTSCRDALQLFVVYRPGSVKITNKFFEEFSCLLEITTLASDHLAIIGDFNIHMDILDCREANRMKDLLFSASLIQHVSEPTHKDGHTLDLLITRESLDTVANVCVKRDLPSDHYAVMGDVLISRPPTTKRSIKSRQLTAIDSGLFRKEIANSMGTLVHEEPDVNQMVESFNNTLGSILDRHAPLKTREVSLRPKAPWYTDSVRSSKREKRRLERKWQKSKLTVDHVAFRNQCHQYKKDLDKAKTEFHCAQISACDTRQMFKLVNQLSVFKPSKALPSHSSKNDLAKRFSQYFDQKIRKIRVALDLSADALDIKSDMSTEATCASNFNQFKLLDCNDILSIIRKSRVKSCALDPLPASLITENLPELLPAITAVVNTSLQSGEFPSALKVALVTPLLKKPSLDVEELKNFRPVSNLPFVGKVIERAAINQLQAYINDNDLHTKNQSAYRRFHSVETAIVRVTNDLLCAVDDHGEAVLVLLDLSAAFDTVDHHILLNRLSARYGVTGIAHQWFASYLKDRKQYVMIDGEMSDPSSLDWGVPQGSVVGPELFVIYSAPIEDIITKHGLSSVSYADDTQIYVVIKPSTRDSAVARVENCIDDIRNWMAANKLMLNDAKTELLHVSSRFSKSVSNIRINIGDTSIAPSETVRDLGITLDSNLTMTSHVNSVCRSASYAIHRIGKLRRYLDAGNTEKLVHAFISSRLDNCNSILYGLPDKELNKLQRIQNAAARLVSLAKKRDHITPVMFQLHWLPVRQRITFKLLLIAFKALNGQAPAYISELISSYQPRRSLRSASQYFLQESMGVTATYGRSFSRVAPRLWNRLPISLRSPQSITSFKSKLKTHLFIEAYGDF